MWKTARKVRLQLRWEARDGDGRCQRERTKPGEEAR